MMKSLMLAILMACIVILNGQPTRYEDEPEDALADSPRDYYFNKAKLNFAQAEAACRRHGMHLVTIMNGAQNNYVQRELRRRRMNYAWIGLNDRSREGHFVWAYGCPGYKNFNRGEPNGRRRENCVHMYHHIGRWNDLNCNSRQPSVCHRATGVDTCGAPSGYAFIRTPMTWAQAEATCRSKGYSLVSINNRGQNSLIQREIRKRGMSTAWLGLNDRAKERKFVWVYGCPKYRNFNRGEPNGGRRENCVHMYASIGRWNDASCSNKYPAVCARPTVGGCVHYRPHRPKPVPIHHPAPIHHIDPYHHHMEEHHEVVYEKVYYRVPADEKKADAAKAKAGETKA